MKKGVIHIRGCTAQCLPSQIILDVSSQVKKCIYSIPVVTTKCNYGGERHWFLCPNPACNQRRKKLYLLSNGLFLCRKCLNLVYTSQNRCHLERIIDKKWTLIDKLGGDSDCILQKPPRMHRKTFDKIQEEIWRLNDLADQGIIKRFGDPYRFFK
jgi:hypothetical protein